MRPKGLIWTCATSSHVVSGAFGNLHRLIAPSLGVVLTFVTLDGHSAMPQPPLANFKGVFNNLRFSMP